MIRICMVGTGYVGLVSGACMADFGHKVTCVDINPKRIESLLQGKIPFYEPGLDRLVLKGVEEKRLAFTTSLAAGMADADVVFIAVQTPMSDSGEADLQYVMKVGEEIGELLTDYKVIVTKSTVPVGTNRALRKVIQGKLKGDVQFDMASNPEFLREGTAVRDFLHPDRVVIGSANRGAAERVAELYATIDTPILITDPASAETIKYAANGFLAMKISFVNAVAAMCEAVGADVAAVVDGIGSDQRIGSQFLRPGPGWGGSCFPKDSRALVKIAEDHGYNFTMMRGVIDVNDEQLERMVSKIAAAAGLDIGAAAPLVAALIGQGALAVAAPPEMAARIAPACARLNAALLARGGAAA
jgi:UDPglucose 6-dehydrogenase